MIKQELQDAVRREIKGLSTHFDVEDYDNAYDDALRDTGFSAPSTNFKIKWIKERMKRALFFYLWSESAHKFKVKQYNVQHRFEHYKLLISKMDRDFRKAQDEDPHEFVDVSAAQLFGHKVDAGFSCDIVGRETTHDDDQEVVVEPTDTA